MGGVQVGGDDDTHVSYCLMCGVRGAVDEAIVRAGVERLTLVVEYVRTGRLKGGIAIVNGAAVEQARCHLALHGGRILHGVGSAREDAIVDALFKGGVYP